MQRQSPEFGAIPGHINAPNVNARVGGTAVDLGNFQALATGAFATLRVATRDEKLQHASFAFESHDCSEPGQLHVVAATSGHNATVAANLVTGTRGWDAGLDAGHYTLWFPIDVSSLSGPVTLTVTWADAGLEAAATISAADLQGAAARAVFV